ncbi:MAG: type I DNA topoisomerase [Candidatus Latescibacteria bacterium]|nr:type I DNA topoisomerase [bacterium]MBD3423084.1 type I DNA topoisomerase [Candidatus Latescibacterota bacterium]
MSESLVIVESPAKARTIGKYLGKGYKVIASVGHIRDLPKNKLGVDIENGFEPRYVNYRDKSKVIKTIKSSARSSSEIFLATDMDREGEAIAWHLSVILDDSEDKIRRVVFNEITERAISEAFGQPRDIDINKVNAQKARRVLDRLVGYLISPVIWKLFYRGLSAGRVQSVGLRLICEREDQISNFKPEEYWTIEGELASSGGTPFQVKLSRINGEKPEIRDQGESEKILKEITGLELSVSAVEKKERKRFPYPPYITSTLQRDASSRLGFSARKTMVIAQQLYEGVELGSEGSVGLISYMRTDSTRISDEAFRNGISCIREKFGPDKAGGGRKKKKSGKSVQDAHEAVRPTDSFRTPQAISAFLSRDQMSLYTLIWQRFLASLAKPAIYENTRVLIQGGVYTLSASGRKLIDSGFLDIMPDYRPSEDTVLPELKKGEKTRVKKLENIQHFTEPPPRYSESALIKTLEENGIGRPSTYASILSVIRNRKYASREGKTLMPTTLGQEVWKALSRHFTDIFEIDFTAGMEKKLDMIEEDRLEWHEVVKQYYKPLKSDLDNFEEVSEDARKEIQKETDQVCENCGRNLVVKWSRNGQFLACPGFPDCKFTKSLAEEELERKCPECGGQLRYKRGRFGRFIACSNYPDCKYTEPIKIGIKCPENDCAGDIIEKQTRKGKIFYGCSRYPDCKFASWSKPVDRKCPKCNYGIMVEKSTKKKGDFLRCPSCKHEENI